MRQIEVTGNNQKQLEIRAFIEDINLAKPLAVKQYGGLTNAYCKQDLSHCR